MNKLLVALLVCLNGILIAQETNLSPYSRFGIGDLDPGSFILQHGFAGAGVSHVDGYHLNSLNPAGNSFLRGSGFEFGLKTDRTTVSSSEVSATNSLTRLNHFSVAFPMWQGKWGAAFGLLPYSTIGYESSESEFIPELNTTQQSTYIGSGGVNKIFFDLSRRFKIKEDTSRYSQHDYFSLGAELGYLFGSLNTERISSFPDTAGFINTRIEDAFTLNDVAFNTSALIRYHLDRKESEIDRSFTVLNLGASLSHGTDLNTNLSRSVSSFVENASGLSFDRDSISEFSDLEGIINIPDQMIIGASIDWYFGQNKGSSQRKVSLMIDHQLASWSDLKLDFGEPMSVQQLGERKFWITGLSYTPDVSNNQGSRGGILRTSSYRLGARTGTSHLVIDNQELSEYGIAFGMSIPLLVGGLRLTDTQFDFGVEYGKRGTTDNGLLEEDFFRIMIGFNFHPERFDRWFVKRKYD